MTPQETVRSTHLRPIRIGSVARVSLAAANVAIISIITVPYSAEFGRV